MIRVGLTVSPQGHAAPEALWSSGLTQNILFLALLFQRLPDVQVAFVSPPGDWPNGALPGTLGVAILPADQALDGLDVLIEIGTRLDRDLLARFRARGGRLVSYMAGNVMAMNFEAVANGMAYGDVPAGPGYDAAWLTMQHWHMNRSYAALTRTPVVRCAPHIWTPRFLEHAIAQDGNDRFFWKARPREAPWRLGVFDPTVNVVKTFHLPLLVAEEAARAAPGLVERVLLFSADRFKGNAHFEEFAAALDLGRQGRIFAEARHRIAAVLGRHVDAVVTHQWQNELNYLYWDVLHSGRPLVHNSDLLDGVGYHYAAFDPQDGGRVLADALRRHGDADLRARQQQANADYLWQLDIDNPLVRSTYTGLLEELMDTRA